MTNITDKGVPLMKLTFFDDDNPKRKTYIEREALIKELTRPTGFRAYCEDCTSIDCLDCIVEDAIKTAPAADMVEVVRCKDCIFSRPVIGTAYLKFCKKFDYEMWHEGFCYYGEKIGD